MGGISSGIAASQCIAIGTNALLSSGDFVAGNSSYTIAIGMDAGRRITATAAGIYNTIIGTSAGAYLTTGGSNVILGFTAMSAATTAGHSIAIGAYALRTHTTGARNIAIGYGAMDDTNAGSTSLGSTDNIFMGYDAGGGTWADAASSYNVGIGNYAMDAALNGAGYNTALSHQLHYQ
jgi:hypothetical protein